MYYLNCFFIYSILGFLFENVVSRIRKRNFNSGILFGPWTPIYGIGVDFILVLSKFLFQNLHFVKWREIVIVFFVLILVLTFLEWLGGILIEKLFHITFWNYEEFRFHIGKYIALEVSFAWGFLSLILLYGIHPFLHSFILMIPSFITYLFLIFIVIDLVCTFLKYKYHYFSS